MADFISDYRQDPIRLRNYKKLGFDRFLTERESLSIGELPLHCDLYRFSEDAPCILFLPGIGTYVELYCELLSKLSQQGFNVIAMDLRGHGYSGGSRGKYRIEEVVKDAQQVIDQLSEHLSGPWALFGSSMGARLALAINEADERIHSLLCHTLFLAERPPNFWHHFGWSSLSFSNLFFPDMKIDFRTFVDIDRLLINSPMGDMADEDPLLVWDYPVSTLHSVFSTHCQILKRPLNNPAAILVGSEDEVLPLSYIQQLIRDSKQPFELIEIAGGSHMLPFERINDTLCAASSWFKQTLS